MMTAVSGLGRFGGVSVHRTASLDTKCDAGEGRRLRVRYKTLTLRAGFKHLAFANHDGHVA